MDVGDTFLPKNGHLRVCIAKDDAGNLVSFSVASFRLNCDTACVLETGDHPFIKHKSYVSYANGHLITPKQRAEIEADRYIFEPHVPLGAKLLTRIQQGALGSLQTPLGLRRIVTGQLEASEPSRDRNDR